MKLKSHKICIFFIHLFANHSFTFSPEPPFRIQRGPSNQSYSFRFTFNFFLPPSCMYAHISYPKTCNQQCPSVAIKYQFKRYSFHICFDLPCRYLFQTAFFPTLTTRTSSVPLYSVGSALFPANSQQSLILEESWTLPCFPPWVGTVARSSSYWMGILIWSFQCIEEDDGADRRDITVAHFQIKKKIELNLTIWAHRSYAESFSEIRQLYTN